MPREIASPPPAPHALVQPLYTNTPRRKKKKKKKRKKKVINSFSPLAEVFNRAWQASSALGSLLPGLSQSPLPLTGLGKAIEIRGGRLLFFCCPRQIGSFCHFGRATLPARLQVFPCASRWPPACEVLSLRLAERRAECLTAQCRPDCFAIPRSAKKKLRPLEFCYLEQFCHVRET